MEFVSSPVSIKWNIRHYGVRAALRWLRRASAYHAWLRLTPQGRREMDFDSWHRVDTDGYASREQLGLPQDAIEYAPVRPRRFLTAMRRLRTDAGRFTFIDIGCGKGRALILASQVGFRRLIGVEYSADLAETARQNLARSGIPAEVLTDDACDFPFPPEPSVVYLYNPFWSPSIDILAENLSRSLAEHPRELYVVYLNPFCEEAFMRQPNLRLVHRSANELAIFRTSDLGPN